MERLWAGVAVIALAVAGVALGLAVTSWQAAEAALGEAGELRGRLAALEQRDAGRADPAAALAAVQLEARKTTEDVVLLERAVRSVVTARGGCWEAAHEAIGANVDAVLDVSYGADLMQRALFWKSLRERAPECKPDLLAAP